MATTFSGYIGTYTKGESKGIYTFTLNTDEAKITDIKLAAANLENPTYLNISQDNRFLFSVMKKGEEGGVASYAIDPATRELTLINTQLLSGSSPCYVSSESKNNFIFSANYHKGEIISYLLNPETGSINPPASVIKHEGSGPDPRQEKAHAHIADVTPDGKYLVVADLGIDFLFTYEVSEDGKLSEVSRLAIRPGSGPRHIVYHPNGKTAYLLTELSSEVIVLDYHSEDGHFSEKQTISTIPADFTENNQSSAIHISSDGRFVYAGNRGHNSITVFSVNEATAELSLVQRISTEGDWPRDFALDPTEKFIVASNQESANLVLFARDETTGKLTLIQSDVKLPYPVCVKFLHY